MRGIKWNGLVASLALTLLLAVPALGQDDLVAAGDAAYAAGDLEAAESYYTQAIEGPALTGQELVGVAMKRGYVRLELGRTEEALADIDLAVDSNYCWSEPFALRGLASLEMGEPEIALAFAGHAVRMDPDNAFSHDVLSHILASSNWPDAAEREARRAAELAPMGPSTPGSDAMCDMQLGRNDAARATLAALAASNRASDENLALLAYLDALDGEAGNDALQSIAARSPETLASLWLALLSPPETRRRLLEERIASDPLDLLAGLALADAEEVTGANPFAVWAGLVEGRPRDALMAEFFALGEELPFDHEEALARAERARAGLAEPFGMVRALALSIALARTGEGDIAEALRRQVALGKYPYGDGFTRLLASSGP